jgi:hypothetical protein
MNITKGQSSQKQHLKNGSNTCCNRKSSGINNNDMQDFKFWAEKYPEICCTQCLNRYNETNKK